MGGGSPQVDRVLGALEGLSADQARATLQEALAKVEQSDAAALKPVEPSSPISVAASARITDEIEAVPTSPQGRQVVRAAPPNRQQQLILAVLGVLCLLSGGVLVLLIQRAHSEDAEALVAPPPPPGGADGVQAWSNEEDELPSLSHRHTHAVTTRPAPRVARSEAESKPKPAGVVSAPRPKEAAAPPPVAATPAPKPAATTQSGEFEDEDLKAMRH